MSDDPKTPEQETALATVAAPLNPYDGIAAAPWSPDARAVLGRPLADDEIEVRPDDGILYLPGVNYRRRLNEAFGIGGWGLAHNGQPQVQGNQVFAPMRLYVLGRFAAEAMGEGKWISNNPKSTFGTALESAKTNAMHRCCKDLGIAPELADPKFTREWRARNVVQVRNPDPARFGRADKVWVRRDDACLGGKRDAVSGEGEAPRPASAPGPRTAAQVPATGGPVTSEQVTLIHVLKGQIGGLTDEAYRSQIAVYRQADGKRCVGADGKGTSKLLSKDQATHLIDRMQDKVHRQGMHVDERVDTAGADLAAVVDARPEANLDDLFVKSFEKDEDEARWLHGFFGVELRKELSREQADTALQLLLAMQGDGLDYDKAIEKARALGRLR